MKRLNALLERADEGLRALLLGRKMPAWLLGVLTFAAFYALMMTRTLMQLSGVSMAARAWGVLVLCVPLAIMLRFALRLTKEKSTLERLGAFALCALAMLARVSFIERSSGDYDIYLADWIAKLAAGSFGEGMRANIGEYNVLYQYILFVITRLGVPALYAVKAVSFVGDAFLAGACARLAGKKNALTAFGAALLLPTLVLNGGMFAQCDSLYAACALWGLALALENKPSGSAACFALSLSFKLQSAFILPIIAVLWAGRKLRVREALIFVFTLIAVMLPALLGGKSAGDIIGIYAAQTGLYTGLNYNAAGFFGLMETNGLDVYAYGNFAMALAFGACALLLVWGLSRAAEMEDGEYVRLALMLVLAIVFLLPRMHERYFYLATPLSIALASRRGGRAVIAAALIELALLSTYWALAIPLSLASGMMLTAIALVLADCRK
ncbi:MAG: hypothetical protein IJ313_00855 [Clostridia bacterium]|nr:hypothetical protein [Clostridia bacterium]